MDFVGLLGDSRSTREKDGKTVREHAILRHGSYFSFLSA